MNGVIGFAIGLVAGVVVTTLVRLFIKPVWGGSVIDISPVCDGHGNVDVSVTLEADPGSTITGIYWKIYDDTGESPDANPNDAGATRVNGAGPTFDLQDLACSSADQDKIAVWPVFESAGAPVTSSPFGPCTTTTLDAHKQAKR